MFEAFMSQNVKRFKWFDLFCKAYLGQIVENSSVTRFHLLYCYSVALKISELSPRSLVAA